MSIAELGERLDALNALAARSAETVDFDVWTQVQDEATKLQEAIDLEESTLTLSFRNGSYVLI